MPIKENGSKAEAKLENQKRKYNQTNPLPKKGNKIKENGPKTKSKENGPKPKAKLKNPKRKYKANKCNKTTFTK